MGLGGVLGRETEGHTALALRSLSHFTFLGVIEVLSEISRYQVLIRFVNKNSMPTPGIAQAVADPS